MKKLVSMMLLFFAVGCHTATLEKPKKYDIYLDGICKKQILKYVDFLKKQKNYKTHKMLFIDNSSADFTYTSQLYEDDLFKKTSEFFADHADIKLNSNVLKIKGTDQCD